MKKKYYYKYYSQIFEYSEIAQSFTRVSKLLERMRSTTLANKYIDKFIGIKNVKAYYEDIKDMIYDKVLDYIIKSCVKKYKETQDIQAVKEYLDKINPDRMFLTYIRKFGYTLVKQLLSKDIYQFEDEFYNEAIERIYYENSYQGENETYLDSESEIELTKKSDLTEETETHENIIESEYQEIVQIIEHKKTEFIKHKNKNLMFTLSQEEIKSENVKDVVDYLVHKYKDILTDSEDIYDLFVKIFCIMKLSNDYTMFYILKTTKVKKSKKIKESELKYLQVSYSESLSKITLLLQLYLDNIRYIFHKDMDIKLKNIFKKIIYFLIKLDGYIIYNNPNNLFLDFIKYSEEGCTQDTQNKYVIRVTNKKCDYVDVRVPYNIISTLIAKSRAFIYYVIKHNTQIKDEVQVEYQIRNKDNINLMIYNYFLFYIYVNLDLVQTSTGSKHYNNQRTIQESYNIVYKSTIFSIIRDFKRNLIKKALIIKNNQLTESDHSFLLK